MYDIAIQNGALGGKILGAGGGGFLLIFANPENHPNIKEALSDFSAIDFEFEDKGCHVCRI